MVAYISIAPARALTTGSTIHTADAMFVYITSDCGSDCNHCVDTERSLNVVQNCTAENEPLNINDSGGLFCNSVPILLGHLGISATMPRSTLVIKSSPITDDYAISDHELGVGMSGKVN